VGIYDHIETFCGKKVVEFNSNEPLDPDLYVYKIGEEYEDEHPITERLASLLADPRTEELKGLVLGAWSGVWEGGSSDELVDAVAAAAPQLPNLVGLFLGDIVGEECEISWINQCDISALWEAYPNLQTITVRGGNELSLGNLTHGALQSLTIECGGLPQSVLNEIVQAKLPALERLELYLGTDGYGWDGSIADLQPIFESKLFPKLKYLGLRDSEIADEIAKTIATAPVLAQLEELDLSLGTLGDEGAKALLESAGVKRLKRLNLRHHYCSEKVAKELQNLPCEVDVDDRQDEGRYGRYVAVGE
jgi:hypothetical protein